jgi:outer membrane protein TolC
MPDGDKIEGVLNNIGQSVGISPDQLNSGLTSTLAKQNNVTSNLLATWPIYTGGRIIAAQNIATGKVNEAKYNLKLQIISQFENLVRYYFGAVLAKQVYATRINVETGLKKHRDNAVLLEKQGQIARVERLQADASLDKAVVERKKAGRDLEIAQVALSRMLKSADLVVPADMLFITDQLPPLDQFIDKTMHNYPALGVLESKNEQAAGLVDVEKGKYLPTVALFGSVNLYREDDLLNNLLPDWFVGVGLNVQLLDRSGRSGQLGAARSTIKRLKYLDLQARSDLSVLVEKTYLQAEQALEEYHGLQSSLRLAEETVSLRTKAFNQGLSTSLDVVDAEMFLAGVETQRSVAAYNYIVSLGQVLAVSGEQEGFFSYQNNNGIEGP